MFIDPIAGRFQNSCELVGLCDPSAVRRNYHQQRLVREFGSPEVPTFDDFEVMLQETKPETVIVCTPDYLHHHYIVRSLESGAEVVSEKPLTIDGAKCREILDAVDRTGGRVRTTFNYRWMPGTGKVKELLASGAIGRVKHVNFEYMLNTAHGADYFRRWHSQKECSGGLLVHKATHHFDLINWWIDGIPQEVFAFGDLVFYGKKNALQRGQTNLTAYDRYTNTDAAKEDPFRLLLDEDPALHDLYLAAEQESGYIRDRNVFRDGITIEDSMSLLIKYRTGVMVNYSLNAFCPCEGFRVAISGDEGRIVYTETHGSHIITGSGEAILPGEEDLVAELQLQKLFQDPETIPVPVGEGSHGGGDPLLQEQIFSAQPPADLLHRGAGHEQGIASILVGTAGNQSMATGLPVRLDDILMLRPEARHLSQLV